MDPFAPGDVLPEDALRSCLKRCGGGVRVFRGCRLLCPERIEIGDCSQVDEGVWVFAGRGVMIGRHVHLAFGASITGGGECVIGDFAGIGAGVRLVTGSEDVSGAGLTNPTVPESMRRVERGRVQIGAHAIVFTNSVVLPNVTIGEGAVVSAGAVVHHDLKPWSIYAGNPLVQVGLRPAGEVLANARELLGRSAEGR